mmetsp:Transcript_17172/g.36912  ORF Transcript_17172/g.36912 Transcript_17172/m.36912 type:complete len:241 (-) Transcript_17172:719-1441(-)
MVRRELRDQTPSTTSDTRMGSRQLRQDSLQHLVHHSLVIHKLHHHEHDIHATDHLLPSSTGEHGSHRLFEDLLDCTEAVDLRLRGASTDPVNAVPSKLVQHFHFVVSVVIIVATCPCIDIFVEGRDEIDADLNDLGDVLWNFGEDELWLRIHVGEQYFQRRLLAIFVSMAFGDLSNHWKKVAADAILEEVGNLSAALHVLQHIIQRLRIFRLRQGDDAVHHLRNQGVQGLPLTSLLNVVC